MTEVTSIAAKSPVSVRSRISGGKVENQLLQGRKTSCGKVENQLLQG